MTLWRYPLRISRLFWCGRSLQTKRVAAFTCHQKFVRCNVNVWFVFALCSHGCDSIARNKTHACAHIHINPSKVANVERLLLPYIEGRPNACSSWMCMFTEQAHRNSELQKQSFENNTSFEKQDTKNLHLNRTNHSSNIQISLNRKSKLDI